MPARRIFFRRQPLATLRKAAAVTPQNIQWRCGLLNRDYQSAKIDVAFLMEPWCTIACEENLCMDETLLAAEPLTIGRRYDAMKAAAGENCNAGKGPVASTRRNGRRHEHKRAVVTETMTCMR